MKEWTTPDSRNTPSTTNLEEEETVDAPGNDGNASMQEQVKRPNPRRKMMMMIKFYENFMAEEFQTDGQTDMKKPSVAFLNFTIAPNNRHIRKDSNLVLSASL